MAFAKQRKYSRALMSIGATAIFFGAAIMVHGEMDFGDGVIIGGILAFLIGLVMLARMPTSADNPAEDSQ